MRWAVLAVLGLLVCGGAAPSMEGASTASALRAPLNLVFTSDRDGDFDVYSSSADGRTVAVLTRNHSRDSNVILSRVGGRLAFRTDYMNGLLLGTNARGGRRFRGIPVVFAANGRQLAIDREDSGGRSYVDVLAVGGGAIRHFGRGEPLAFSPDARLLSYTSTTDGVIYLKTRRRRVLAAGYGQPALNFSPTWRRFAFYAEPDEFDEADLVVAQTGDPRATRRIVAHTSSNDDVLWLDDDHLAFEPSESPLPEVDIVDTRDSSTRKLQLGEDSCCVQWSPQRDRFAYQPNAIGDGHELVVAGTNGETSESLRLGSLVNGFSWSPSGSRLAVLTGTNIVVVDPSSRPLVPRVIARLRNAGTVVWASDGSALAVSAQGRLLMVPAAGGAARTFSGGGHNEIVGWLRGPRPPNVAALRPKTPVADMGVADGLKSRGKVLELASDGRWVGAIIDKSGIDCTHVAAWSAARPRVIRFAPIGRCEYVYSYAGLSLLGTTLAWTSSYCGNYCYAAPFSADVRHGGSQRSGDEDTCGDGDCAPPRPLPPRETRRGVAISVHRGTITLRRLSDGRRRLLRPPGGTVDAELEDAGLYYAYNEKGRFPGRLAFIPFSRLFR